MSLSYGRSIGSVLLVGATLSAQGDWTDPSPHTVAFVGIEQGVALEVLDWGGQGPPMILLAGLGNTAHVFDQFALHFTDRFHVIGITRRGYGASGHPSDGYEIASLANDIRGVCDRLNVTRAILVGHSLGGDEMTKFASTYPDRVSALVYLDGAYDRTNSPPEGIGPAQAPTANDLASIGAYGDYLLRTRGMRVPEADLRYSVVMDQGGRLLRGAIPSTTPQAIGRGLERPDYTHVQAAALAIYQPNELRFNFPNYANLNDADKARAEAVIREGQPFVDRSIDQFRREMAHGRIVRLTTGSHYMFITNADEVVHLMRDFINEVLANRSLPPNASG